MKTGVLTIRLSEETRDRLIEKAKESGEVRNAYLVKILEGFLNCTQVGLISELPVGIKLELPEDLMSYLVNRVEEKRKVDGGYTLDRMINTVLESALRHLEKKGIPSGVHTERGRNSEVAIQCEVPEIAQEKVYQIDIGNGEIVDVPEHLRVAGQPSNATIPIYDKSIHKPGDRVLVKIGSRLVPQTVPDLDGEGREIPEVK